MISGDPSGWSDLLQPDFVPTVIDCVLRAWRKIRRPAPSSNETAISLRLVKELIGVKNRSRLPIRFGYEVVELDFVKMKAIGRKDLVAYPRSYREEVYLGLEAKRLNVRRGRGWASLANEYVTKGMQRFVNGKYARGVQDGLMLGYVMDSDLKLAKKKVDEKTKLHCGALQMKKPGGLAASSIKPGSRRIRESRHSRKVGLTPFCLHHVFLARRGAGSAIRKRQP